MPEENTGSILKSIRELKEQDPFSPFEILLSSGDRYLIETGGNLVEMRSEFFYAFPGGDRWVLIRHSKIAAVEIHKPVKRRAGRKAS